MLNMTKYKIVIGSAYVALAAAGADVAVDAGSGSVAGTSHPLRARVNNQTKIRRGLCPLSYCL